ncbi:hypothetical protein [Paenibacillus sp. DYY-L-2]|uniref:hypothetical protein n=1 Tax=Paenibacillus sp. DYY-L-2 TaxID=3447013 RepID=UPI003F509EE5
MSKLIAAIICPFILSLWMSLSAYTPKAEQLPNVSYHPFWALFLIGFLILFAIYLVIGIPLTGFIDGLAAKYANTKAFFHRCYILVPGYALGGAFTGLLFGWLFQVTAPWSLMPLFAAGGLLFLIIQGLLAYVGQRAVR